MDITKYFEIITNYQINTTVVAISIIALLISGLFYYYTNNIKPTLILLLSILLVPFLTLTFLLISYEFFNVQPSEKHTLILWSSLFVNTINLSMLIGKYSKEILKKNFDINDVIGYHFIATLNLFVTMLLITFGVSVFVETNIIIILGLTFLISSITIWFNHLFTRFLLKEK